MSQGYQLVSAPMPKLLLPAAGGALSLSRQPVDAAEWETGQSYILFDQLVLLDIIVANQWQRPVCFAMTCAPAVRSNWSNHLALEGLVYRVYPDEQQAWGYSWYDLPEKLAAAGEPAQAELLALQIVQNYKSGRLPAEELKSRDIVFISLSNVARTYGLEKLKTAIYGK